MGFFLVCFCFVCGGGGGGGFKTEISNERLKVRSGRNRKFVLRLRQRQIGRQANTQEKRHNDCCDDRNTLYIECVGKNGIVCVCGGGGGVIFPAD